MGLVQVVTKHRGPAAAGRVRPRHGILLLLGAAPLALAACGSTPASGTGTSTTVAGKASAAAYTACLKQHGVTLPSFGRGTGGPPADGGTRPSFSPGSGSFPRGGAGGFANNPKFKAAAADCKKLRPAGGFGGFGRGGAGGFNSTAFAAYRNCLQLHGVTLPTGRPPAGGAGSTPSTTFNQSSPTVQAAMAACAALRPSASTTTTTTAA